MHSRSRRTDDLVIYTNQELARLERENRKKKSKSVTMGDNFDPAALNAQLERMQRTIDELTRQPPVQPTLGGDARPHTYYRNRSAIVPPTIDRQDYEIKAQLIQLVEQRQFCGLSTENPNDHIERFEKICSTSRANGVSPEYLRCVLFEFSLADRAAGWLTSLEPASLIGWDATRNAFLDKYYTKSKTASLKGKITNFQQLPDESFYEAWERFKRYKRDCPHHGYSDIQLLEIFYDGVNWDYKTALNAASNGNFMKQTVAMATELIENYAESTCERSSEYDRSRKVSSIDAQTVAELNSKLNLLLQNQQRGVQQVESTSDAASRQEYNEERSTNQQDVNYVNGQEFAQNRAFNPNRNHPNLSYRNPNVENPQDQTYPQQHQQQHFQTAFAPKQPFNKPPAQFQPSAPPQYQAPAPAPSSSQDEVKLMFQQLMINQQKSASDVKIGMENINTKVDNINMKVDSMYTDLNGKIGDLNGKFEALSSHVKKLDIQVAQTAEAVKRQEGVLPGKTNANPRQFVNAIMTNDETEVCLVSQKVMGEEELVLSEKTEEADEFEDKPRMERVYIPKAPYPTRPYKPRSPIQPVVLQKEVTVPDDKEKAAPPLRKLEKMENPGQFYITCSVNGIVLKDSLCDSGANVNVMSQVVAKKLGILDMQSSKVAVSNPFSSSVTPKGFVRDVMLQIGDCLVPVDFHIMEINEDSSTPMILGSSFLATVGALMDFRNQRISFSKINKKVFYPVILLGNPSCMSVNAREVLILKAEDKKSRPFSNISIIIPPALRDKETAFIEKELQKSIALFPHIVSWETREGKLVGKTRKRSQTRTSGFEGVTSSTDPSPA